MTYLDILKAKLGELVDIAEVLAGTYHAVVTNPPYMGSGGMNVHLSSYVKREYEDSKSDLSTVFMEKTINLCKAHGYMAMINIPGWMFLSSFEKLRISLLTNRSFINLLHFGRGIFGADFGTTAFVINASYISNYIGL
jgi:tRNA1(Val) A37 N6-methylase TrmN6